MGLVMQVDAFTGHIGAEQNTQFIFRLAESLDDLLLLNIAHAAVQLGNLLRF